MPYAQPSYTGQGIVQQNVTPRAGEIIGASLANMGQSIGAGIEKFAQRKKERAEREKRESGATKGMRDVLTNLGLMTKEQANSKGFEELMQISAAAPQLLQQQQQKQQGQFIQRYMQGMTPQEVSTGARDVSGEIEATQAAMNRLADVNPDEFMSTDVAPFQITPEPTISPIIRRSSIQKQPVANQSAITNAFIASQNIQPRMQDTQKQEQAQAAQAAVDELGGLLKKLEALQAEQARPKTRPETPEETNKRFQSVLMDELKNNPAAAPIIAKRMFAEPKEPKALTAEEQKSLGYAMRMQSAEKKLSELMQNFSPESAGQAISEMLPNLMKSDNRQQYETVAMDWITAVLRRESGAAIGKDEFQRDFKKYFPQPGDSEGTVDLKRERRAEAIRSITVPMGLGDFGNTPTQTRMRYNPSTGKFE